METQYGPTFQITEIKAANDGWEIAGYASTYGNTDLGGDIVMAGAFDDWLARWRSGDVKTRFLYAHKSDQVLGRPVEMRSDDNGLFVRAAISHTRLGADIHTNLVNGDLDSLSIGFIPVVQEFDDDQGVRRLKQMDLPEFSVVAMPMNELATISQVKSDQRITLNAHVDRVLEDVRDLTGRCKSLSALRAEAGRNESGTVCRVREELPTELKALAAEVEALLRATPEAQSPAEAEVERNDAADGDSRLSVTQLRLRALRKTFVRRGLTEYAIA